jgi:hypothetical protein
VKKDYWWLGLDTNNLNQKGLPIKVSLQKGPCTMDFTDRNLVWIKENGKLS